MTAQQKSLNVLVLGDTCVDVFKYCSQTRLNPESSAPLVTDDAGHEIKDGMAANVAKCLSTLGFNVDLVKGNQGYSIKTRYVNFKTKQQYLRVDSEVPFREIDLTNVDFGKYSAIVVSDYCKGSVTYSTLETVAKKSTCPIFIDTKKPELSKIPSKYNTVFKINELESKKADVLPLNTIVTVGNHGAWYHGKLFPALKTDVVDVCGAGDAFLAGYVYGYFHGIQSTIKYGIVNAGLSVRHIGTYAPSIEELKAGMIEYDKQNQ